MEKITRVYTVYNYDELSEKAKEVVKQWYIDDELRAHWLTIDIECYISENYKHSSLDVQWSLNYCQGDGVNIYGKISLIDLIDKIDYSSFTEKEKRFIIWAVNKYRCYGEISQNNHYCYSLAKYGDYSGLLTENLQDDYIRNINNTALEKFNKVCGEYMNAVCKDFEKYGYEYLYEPSEEEIIEVCTANEWKFTDDGKFFSL